MRGSATLNGMIYRTGKARPQVAYLVGAEPRAAQPVTTRSPVAVTVAQC